MLEAIDVLIIHLTGLTPDGLRAAAGAETAQLASVRTVLANQIAAARNAEARTTLDTVAMPPAHLHGAVDAVALVANTARGGSRGPKRFTTQPHTASTSARAELLRA